MTAARLSLGRAAEALVRGELERRGWRILAVNARTTSGELDLVAMDGRTLVFVEVKAGRLGSRAGPVAPAHAVGSRKRRKLRRVALEWLAGGGSPSGVSGYRFDVVGVSFGAVGPVQLDHIRAAF